MKVFDFFTGKLTRTGLILLAVMGAVFILSLVFFLLSPGSMRLFIFESLDSEGFFAERRFLPKNPEQGLVRQYVDDLLLGPLTPRLQPVFPAGTIVNSCFVRKGTLYVDLSENALIYSNGAAVEWDSVEIFKKNIFANFNTINTIHLYIMGREVLPIM